VPLRRLAGVTLGATVAVAGAAQAVGVLIRRRETLDPDAIERLGAMFYLRGVGIHFVERGGGPPILLVPGFGASTFSLRRQIDALADRFRVLALDLPGFGYSDRPAGVDLSQTAQAERLREFMERMGVERAVVLGHSMGGAIALRLAAAHPERVERLIVVAAPSPDQRIVPRIARFARLLLPAALAMLFREGRVRRALGRIVYDPSFVEEDLVEGYARPLRLHGTTASIARMVGDMVHDPRISLSAIRTRTLLLWGEADPVVPLHVAHRLHAELPDARLEVIPRAGHLVLEEQPEACNQAILRFLTTPAPPVAIETTP
jgi:pimeloyl-ACP methyl ester carboxylesterase